MRKPQKDNLLPCTLALTVAAPMCYVLQLSLGIYFSGWYVFFFSAASLLLLEIIGRNKWTAIGIPAGVLLVSALTWWALGADQRQPLVDFFRWAMYFITNVSEYPFGFGLALTAIVSFLATLFVWLFGRKFFFFLAVFTFVVAVVLLKWLDGLYSVLVPGMLACGGLILLWAKSFQRKVEKNAKKTLPVNGIALFLLPVAALIVGLGFLTATDESSMGWQNHAVYDFFQRVNNYLSDYTHFNRPRSEFSIAAYGFMPMGNRLGGPMKPSDLNVMYVTAPSRMLLRGTIYNNYTGSLWTNTVNDTRRRFGGAPDAEREDVFDLDRPQLTGDAKTAFEQFVGHATITIQPLVDSSSTLFVPPRGADGISSKKFLAVLPYYNDSGEAFSSADVLTGYSYSVDADYINYDVSGFSLEMESLMAAGLRDTPEKEQYISQNYLSLPGGIDQSVYDLTNAIVSRQPIDRETSAVISGDQSETSAGVWVAPPIHNDYDKAVAIKDYLLAYCHYTLTPPVPPDNKDFVSYFLTQDPNGYCTYFASAMCVMARIAGIPSRYVEGYLLPEKSPLYSVYIVQGKNAHAWAELYFEGIGWIPFDATPSGTETGAGESNNNPGDFVPPIPHPVSESPGNNAGTVQSRLEWNDIAAWLWVLPAVVLAIVVAWMASRMIRAKTRLSVANVKKKYKSAKRVCAFYYSELLRLLEYYNYPVMQGETPYAYAARIDFWLKLGTGTFSDVAALIALASYSDYMPSDGDIDFLAGFRRDLARYTYRVVGARFYLWHQVLGFRWKPRRLRVGRKASRARRR